MSGRGRGRRGGGGSGGGGRGHRGGRGRGQPQWGNPEWRAAKLAEIRRNRPPVDPSWDREDMMSKLRYFMSSNQQEMLLGNYRRGDAEGLLALAKEQGVPYSKNYAKGRVVISKVPLPDYRADLDEQVQNRVYRIAMTEGSRRLMREFQLKRPQEYGEAMQHERMPKRQRGPGGSSSSHNNNIVLFEDHEDSEAAIAESLRLMEQQRKALGQPQVQSMMEFRQKLPAFSMRQQMVEAISTNRVLVVSGETGCGKTTQLPQYILESEIDAGRGSKCSIVCTQPRRISAVSVAQRVAQERGEKLGQTVGYHIRLENQRSRDTRLLFCTTGVLLRKLINDPLLKGVSHIIVDEIHERGMNEDFLLIVLRDLLDRRPDLRLVLMSATLNADLFVQYYGGCPRMHIPGFTFPVEDVYLEDVLATTGIRIPEQRKQQNFRRFHRQRGTEEENSATLGYFPDSTNTVGIPAAVVQSMKNWAQPTVCGANAELIVEVVEWICTNEPEGAILVFVPGIGKIAAVKRALEESHRLNPRNTLILPVHSQLPTATQREIFNRPPSGVRKIVVATNIAETSITIDDVVYVVDCGTSNHSSYDAVNKLKTLQEEFISKAQAKQRRGRAGRVQAGKCYHLFPSHMHDHFFPDHLVPEMLRTPLETLVLQLKSLNLGSAEAFLQKAMNPPDRRAIQNALDLLKTIGALDEDEKLTSLGEHLAVLPIDPCMGKMIIMGAIFGCLDPILTIAAAMGYKQPFIISIDNKNEALRQKDKLSDGTFSDHIAIVNAFAAWRDCRGRGKEWQFCREFFLSNNTLSLIDDLRIQFAELLSDQGFLAPPDQTARWKGGQLGHRPPGFYDMLRQEIRRHSSHLDDLELIRAVCVAGLYPNVAMRNQKAKRFSLTTLEDGKVQVHDSSVLSLQGLLPLRWVVYSEKTKMNGIVLFSSSIVTDCAMLLFGGELEVVDRGLIMFGGHGGRHRFEMDNNVRDMLLMLRIELDVLLKAKIEDPALDVLEAAGELVQVVRKLLVNENGPVAESTTARKAFRDAKREQQSKGLGSEEYMGPYYGEEYGQYGGQARGRGHDRYDPYNDPFNDDKKRW